MFPIVMILVAVISLWGSIMWAVVSGINHFDDRADRVERRLEDILRILEEIQEDSIDDQIVTD